MDFERIKNIKGLKYIVVTVLFIVVIVFVDDYSLRVSSRLSREVSELHDEETRLAEAIKQDSTDAAELRSSIDAKEHYGRENYYMKRPDEDVFVIKN
jgi:Tfp pilus assembly protein PilO